ncbi:unnamed protein product [Adineta ricciae]|uniref:Uncharacterized protein n=1 Tax=Adineta ricciae TaxID=249248 RepID=A0A815C4T2_ADIRI|nr:unnamed protein product [Adineta ricciae]CAF1430245.1 unnamed protein product [Adineta ricciae]
MSNVYRFLLLKFYIILNIINCIQTLPNGYLLGASYNPVSGSNAIFKINPLDGKFAVLTPLTSYKAYDVTYDFIHKVLYVFGSQASSENEAELSVMVINPLNGTQKYRPITLEPDADIFNLSVDSSTEMLYSVQIDDSPENPISIVQIDTREFIAKRWVNITGADGIRADCMAVFFNASVHQYFGAVLFEDVYIVGIDVPKQKIISNVTNTNLPSYLCYDNKTDAFYGMQKAQRERGCSLVRLNPYNGSMDVISKYFDDYLPSSGDCYNGYYFTMIVKGFDDQNIVTFDLSDNAKVIANIRVKSYLNAFAFAPN